MSIFGSSPKEKSVSVEQYLQSHNIGKDAFSIKDIHDGKIQLPDDYFVDPTPWTAEEAKTAELRHRLSSRTMILWTLA